MIINFFTPLYLLAIYGLVRYLSKPKEDLKKNKVNWGPLETVGITLLLYFGTQLIAGLLLYGYGLLNGWGSNQITNWTDNSIVAQFLFVALVEGLTVLLLYKFLQRRKANFQTIKLKKPRWSDLAYALLGFAIYFGIFIVVLQVAKDLIPSLNVNQQQQIGFNSPSHLELPLVFISLVVLPPIVEELLVRGFLYSGLKKALPKIWAIIITSGLFASAHLQAGSGAKLLWVAAIDTFILSLVLIYLRDKTDNLWASIFLHAIKNTVAFFALFVFANSLLK
jgi:membrane protease YdiL (CAAX protease family)